jgi:hypothetical protein
MARESTFAGKVGDGMRILTPLAENKDDLPHLELPRAQLAALLAQTVEANAQKAAHRAAKQELTQQINGMAAEADRLATLLRQAVKQHYGIRSPKLTEFDLQPFRGRPRKPKATSPTVPEAADPADSNL